MTTDEIKEDAGIPKLKSYLAAILDVKEKQLFFLPCYSGYLIFVNKKNSLCIWVHKLTIEGILKVGFNLLTEELLFKLLWGGSILREIFKGVIPEAPKDTVIFYPGLHKVEYGSIIPEHGTSGLLVKGINKASEIMNKTSKSILGLIPKEGSSTPNEKEKETNDNNKVLNKSFTYIRFKDFLYTTLSKEKRFKSYIPNLSLGFEFRTVFEEESIEFLKKLEKNGFTVENVGNKGYL